MNCCLRPLAGLVSLGLVMGALAAPMEIRVEPEVQPITEYSAATAKAMRPKAMRVAPILLAAPAPGEGIQARPEGKAGIPLQIGFNRSVPALGDELTTVSTLEWEEQLGGGHLGAISINSPGAAALRVGLVVNRVHPAAVLRFYGPDDAKLFEVTGQEVLDSIARNLEGGAHGRAAHTYWSPVIESATIVIEIELPPGAKTSELRISAPEISHLVTSSRMNFQMPKAAAPCEIDAMCNSATWGSQMNAVARMVFTEPSVGTFLCTGTLLADQVPSTAIPYFLSANHCISTAVVANSLATYWFYRSGACNSGLLGTLSVQLTGGATLLYASATTDTSFMRLNSTPPGGAVYAGWTVSTLPAIGAAVTGIHHPRGDLLKISFGSIVDYATCTPPSSGSFSCLPANSPNGTFYVNTWSSGITEGGSSGSGLFLNNGRYLIGQLYGGTGGCTPQPGDADIYGRLDVAYAAALVQWLGTPSNQSLNVTRSGSGTGTVTSSPAGITCGGVCTANFPGGSSVTLTASPAAGSSFTGWSDACSGTGACTVLMTATTSVNAAFSVNAPPSITVAKAGTGSGVVTSSPSGMNCGTTCGFNLPAGFVITLFATPDPGSAFIGWSGACAGFGNCTVTVNSALTATATFSGGPLPQLNLSVTKSGNGTGTVTSTPAGINCNAACAGTGALFGAGTSVSLTATPSPGSTFLGWSGDCIGMSCSVTMNTAHTVEAVFVITTSMVHVTRSGNGTGSVTSTPAGIDCGITCHTPFPQGSTVTLTATPGAGSAFGGWTGACTGTGTCTVTMNAAATVDAAFNSLTIPTTPSITVQKAGTGSGVVTSSPDGMNCGATCFFNLPLGFRMTLFAAASPGSTFTGWSGACTGTGTCSVTINGPVVVTANFSTIGPPPTQYQLLIGTGFSGPSTGTITSMPAGINCPGTCIASFAPGTVVTLTATPGTGSTFAGWTGPCSGTGACIVTMNSTQNVGANFSAPVPMFTLSVTRSGTGTGSVSSVPDGIGCGGACSATYVENVMVQLTASPTNGSTFAGWSGACTGTGTCVVSMNAPKSVDAAFTAPPPPPPTGAPSITVQKAGSGSGVITSSPDGMNCGTTCFFNLPAGFRITLFATPSPGSVFTGWSGASCSGTASCTVTVNGPVVVTAYFVGGIPPPTQFPLNVSIVGIGTGSVASSPGGISCFPTCGANFVQGTLVTLTASPAGSSTFEGWSGACAGTTGPVCALTMYSALAATASFTAAIPPIRVGLNVTRTGTGTGTVTSFPAGIICGPACFADFNPTTIVTLTATPASGSTFAGWSGACSGTGTCIVTMNAPSAVNAVFTMAPPSGPSILVLKAGTGSGIVTSSPDGMNCGATCMFNLPLGFRMTLFATPSPGSTFTGWSGACSGTGACNVTVNGPTVVTANFAALGPLVPLNVSISGSDLGKVTSTPAGIDCSPTCIAYFAQGTIVTLTATPASPNAYFYGWLGACSGNSGPTCTLTMNSALSAWAIFNPATPPPQFPLGITRSGTGAGTVTSSPAGINCGATCNANFDQASVVMLTATPASGSTFAGWSGACSGTGACSVTMNSASSVNAAFNTATGPSITVQKAGPGSGVVTSSPDGMNCGTTCFFNLPPNFMISLFATPSPGSTFAGWSGACTGMGACTVRINGAMVATATFQ